MADEKNDTKSPETEEQEESPASTGGARRMILLGAGAVALLLAGVGTGFVLFGGSHDDPVESAEPPAEEEVADAEQPAEEESTPTEQETAGDPGTEKAHGAATHHTYPLESFIVNIADRDRDRYLKVKAEIELDHDALSKEIEEKLPGIRDTIISLLGSKSFDEIRSMEGKDLLREELLQRVNASLTTGKARRIFFTEFVVQ